MNRLTVLFLFLTATAVAQDGVFSLGARHAGLGGATTTYHDAWSAFNNVGGFGALKKTTAYASYQNRYGISSFQVTGGGFNYHSKIGNLGVKYYRFGDHLFSQQLAGLVFGNRFQMVSLGGGINVVQTAAEGQKSDRIIALEFGGRAEISPQLLFGAHIFNIRHSHELPTTMKAGISYLPIASLRINAEVEKQLDVREVFKTGLEYRVLESLYLRTGINIHSSEIRQTQVRSHFGFGFNPGFILVDYAFSSHSSLGAVHEVSLTYEFNPS